MNAASLPVLALKRNEERRLRAGHLWVYSNEVDSRRTPLLGFEPGAAVLIQAASGKALGTGYVNPRALLCARILSQRPGARFDAAFFTRRLASALELRTALYSAPCYRLAFGEGDALPGLVIDRYGDVCVVQITTAGMEALRGPLLAALQQLLQPAGILLLNDSPMRELEGLSRENASIGTVPDSIELEEGGGRFSVPLAGGQKTGWFYDQRSNRLAMHKYVRGRRVLDVFSYVGAWGIQAAVAGAAEVCCVDASAAALATLQRNAAASGVAERLRSIHGDAFEVLRELQADGQAFDVVVVDPPAFIKRRKDIHSGEQGYLRLNRLAISLLAPGGILISCSCSMHLAEARLQSIVHQAARQQGRRLQILERGFQAPDHPVHPAIAETAYLKTIFCRLPA